MLRSLFAHFEAKEAEKAPPPESFGSAAARRELVWVTAGRVALAVALVCVAVLTFVGPDLPGAVVTGVAAVLVVAVLVVLGRALVSLSRLAALERESDDAS